MPRHGLIRDPVASHNERVKLIALSLNAVGLGLIGFAILRPLTDDPATLPLSSIWWGAAGLAFHALAHYILHTLIMKDRADDPL